MMGADVICSSPGSALVVQKDRNCDLVVLCHSLREPFSASLAETIRSHWPNTRILQVTSSRIGEAAEAVPAVDAISSADPERLIMRAVELLGRRQSRSIQPPDRTSGRLSA
jgi:DNA-binding NarL/FixJ family response regulator